MRKICSILVVIAVGLGAGCATRFEVVQLPLRSADLYPVALTVEGATVAIDEIRDSERARRYFGIDLLERDVLPVNIVVSNRHDHPILVNPADVMLHRSGQIIDPLPLSEVAGLAKRSGRLNRETREQVDAYYREVAFASGVIPANSIYQGVMFFHIARPETARESMFRRVSLWMHGGMQLDVVLETLDRHERLRFGPFSLVGPRGDDWF